MAHSQHTHTQVDTAWCRQTRGGSRNKGNAMPHGPKPPTNLSQAQTDPLGTAGDLAAPLRGWARLRLRQAFFLRRIYLKSTKV